MRICDDFVPNRKEKRTVRVRVRRFSPGLFLRGQSGSEFSRLGAEDGGASAISAVGGGVGVVVAAISFYTSTRAIRK